MITKIKIELDIPNQIQVRYMGSVLHGVLMEYLPNDVAEQLHHNFAYSPLKQRIYLEDNKSIWEIVSMSEELSKTLIYVFSTENNFYLKHYQESIKLKQFNVEKFSINEMMSSYLGEESLTKFIKIKILTPMSFKSNQRYMVFPDMKKFFRSIMVQCDAFFNEYDMYDRETLEFLSENVFIVDYRMKSSRFNLERVKIPSFLGEFTIKVNGPTPFLQLIHFLLEFGELSGVGIKTSLGMGKYSVIKN